MRFILHVTLIPLFCWTVASGQEHYDPEVYDFQGYVFEVVGDGHIPLPDVTVTNESGDTTTTTNTGYFCIPFGGTQNLNEALNFSKDGYKIVQKTFRGDCQFWKITMQKASSQRVTIGPEGKDHTFFCEYIENYQKEGYDNSVSLYIGPDSVDQEWNVGVTVDRVHTGYHLGINPGTGEPGFQYLGYSSFSVHVDGKQPWEHVPVSGYGNFFEIPCHEDYDSTGVMPFSLDVLVYDHHAHTWVEEVFVDNRGWLKCGYATFDPVRWIWRWEGFEFISGDFILVYTYILGKGEKTRDGLRKEPVPMPNSDRSHTMLSGHNTTKNWLEQNGIKNPENYIKRMRDSEGNYLNLNELEFIDPETGKPTTGFRISAYFGYDLDVTVSTSKTKGDHFDTKIGVSGGVSFEILDFGGSVETTAGSNWSKTRGMSQRFAEKIPEKPWDSDICFFILYAVDKLHRVSTEGYVSGVSYEFRPVKIQKRRIPINFTPGNNHISGKSTGGSTGPAGGKTPKPPDSPQGPPTKNPGDDDVTTGKGGTTGDSTVIQKGNKKKK